MRKKQPFVISPRSRCGISSPEDRFTPCRIVYDAREEKKMNSLALSSPSPGSVFRSTLAGMSLADEHLTQSSELPVG